METIALSLLLILSLTVLVGCILAAELTVARQSDSAETPTGIHPGELIQRGSRALFQQYSALAGLAETSRQLVLPGCLIALLGPVLAFAVIPMAPPLENGQTAVMIAADLDAAIPFLLAMLAVGLFGRMLVEDEAGQADRLQGRLICIAAVGISTMGIVRLTGAWRLDQMVAAQEELGVWWLARQPLGFAAMLLALVWCIFGTESPKADRGDLNFNRGSLPERLIQRVPLILLAYLLVMSFAGGWHVWEFAGDIKSSWTVWVIQCAVLHLKVVLLLGWLIWLRYVRLPEATVSSWRSRIGMAALIAGTLNAVVVELSEQYLAGHPDIWKAAVAWGALMIALLAIGVFAQQIAPD